MSRNGRDVKIDILDDYIRTSERFRVIQAFFWSTGRLPEPPWGKIGPTWAIGKRGGSPQGAVAPLPIGSLNWTREGGAPPFLLLLLSLPSSPLSGKRKGVQLGLGVLVGLPSMARPLGRPPPPPLLYIRGRGHPIDTQVSLSRVRCPPPQLHTSVISS